MEEFTKINQPRIRPRMAWTAAFLLPSVMFATGCFAPPAPVQGEPDTASARIVPDPPCTVPNDSEKLTEQVLQLINSERAKADLPPVVRNPNLDQLADDYACRMISADFFAHEDPASGEGPAERALGKYRFLAMGENLAAGQQTPDEVMRMWMESPSHREIILDAEWTEVGIGVQNGGEYSYYWVQEFGHPSDE
ncbi:MAG: CAP domain-containing protein [Planctomycetes bacterium]|nr:CAP domain-containing protein [Planctomycetota bacterium]